MSNVIDFEKQLPHVANEVICIACHHRYIAVAPSKIWLKDYKCGECQKIGTIIKTGEILEGEE